MIYPLLMMLFLVLILFGLLFVVRMSALYTKRVDLKYFEVFEGAKPPSYLTKVTNNLNNVFEVPPLFYMAATLVMVLNLETDSIIFNAWGFVITRYIHSFIHITLNNYLMRGGVFTVSIYFLVILWWDIVEKL
ncbi:MAG: hypothetical protein COB62_01185 [Piscirickettsiaceae bacterium]|nr:MAG: hypothetical protein COB62_01185 [Piscirickettsiaceae bacterium]